MLNRDNYPEIITADLRRVGGWQVFVTTPKGNVDITVVRGITTEIEQLVETDPFGPASGELRFPALSMLDSLGEGDLWWWRAGYPVDITWRASEIKGQFLRSEVRWEGYIAGESSSFADDGGQVRMTLKGALRQVDNTIVMPEYPQQPWPFEHAIAHALDRARFAGARIGQMSIEWPVGWNKKYSKPADQPWWMQPLIVKDGDNWTEMMTRETGQNEPALTSYIAGLLSSMHTDTGQFTLMLDTGRVPVLRHRSRIGTAVTGVIDIVTPGVSMEISCDYEAKSNVIFGKGRGLDGISFSNIQYDNSGRTAYYLPFASHQTVYPSNPANPSYAGADAVRRDTSLTFYDGMSSSEATKVAEKVRQRFSQAGYVGTLTLTTDPYVETADGRVTLARHSIRAGDVIRVLHFQGRDSGVAFHVTEANHSISDGTSTLTIDTVFRDHVTTEEVRLRGRDALTQVMTLTTGQYNVNVRDQMLPWGPESGYLPVSSKGLFDAAPSLPDQAIGDLELTSTDRMPFPWDYATKAMPPRDARYTKYYVRIPAAGNRLHDNWNNPTIDSGKFTVIQLSQAGGVALLQVMAVDADGNRLKVPFHISFYMNASVSATNMPLMDPTVYAHPFFPSLASGVSHPYPFFPGAWENINEDGSLPGTDIQRRVPAEGSGQVAGYGTYRIPAGYYPNIPTGTYPVGMQPAPTGLLAVENPFQYDISKFQKDFNPFDPARNSLTGATAAGIFGVMIYCDSMWDGSKLIKRNKDVYFIGRLFRTPPGTG